MLEIGNTLISLDVITEHFVCDLEKCKGACCIDGDAGAPLEEDETRIIEEIFDKIKKYLPEKHLQIIEKQGMWEKDEDGDLVTVCAPSGACVFLTWDEKGIAKCAFEIAWEKGETDWPKPISCHLYPIRLAEYPEFIAVNYSRRDICAVGRIKGRKEGVKVYEFLKFPLIRKFGEQWYEQLDFAAKHLKIERNE